MSKYNVGDKVKIREDLVVGKDYGSYYFIYSMGKFKGKEVIITKVLNYENGEEAYKIEGWYWTDEMIEGLVKDIVKETSKESIPKFKLGDKVELISVDGYDKVYSLEIGDMGIITNIEYFPDACTIKFSKVSSDKAIFYNQIKLVEEEVKEEIEDVLKPKYVKCTKDNFYCISKDKIYEVISESDDTYLIKIDNPSDPLDDEINYLKCHFIEVDSPIETVNKIISNIKPKSTPKSTKGVIKYKIKGDTTTVKLNGKIGKATRNSIDEPDDRIGILIGLCRTLSISEEKVQDIIDILFDNEDTKAKYGCENAVMKNDIARALSILDKYKEQ